jgi:hypothetical protein
MERQKATESSSINLIYENKICIDYAFSENIIIALQ